jgi:hypothetical protein
MTFKLPEITYPLTIDTIGTTLAMGHEISVHCHSQGCGHTGRLNLVRLARRVGMDYSSDDVALREIVYCPHCREAGRDAKNIGFIHHSQTDPFSLWPRQKSAYEKAKGG